MIPVDIEVDWDLLGFATKERQWFGPDTKVGLVSLPYDAVIRPWWPKRPMFREPTWYEATWEEYIPSGNNRVRRGDCIYHRSGSVWFGERQGWFPTPWRGSFQRPAGVKRYRRWTLTKREVQKLKLPPKRPTATRIVRERFSLQKLYGIPTGRNVMLLVGGEWVKGAVGEYELWKDSGRVQRNQESKRKRRHNRYMRQPTWLDRVLGD